MQFKVPRQVAIASALALVLGIVSPSAAFAADDAVNPSDDDKSTLVVVQDQDVEEDLDDEEYLDEDDEYLDDEFEDDYVDGEFEDDAYSEDDFEDDDEYLDEDDFEDDEEYLDADDDFEDDEEYLDDEDDFEDDEEYLDDEDDYADDDFEDDEEFLDEDDYADDDFEDDEEFLDEDDDEYLDDDEEYSDEDDFEDDDEYLDDEEFEDDDECLDEDDDDFEDDEDSSGEVDFTGEINYELTDAVTEKSAPIGMMATSAVDAPMVTSAAPKSVEDGKRTIADGVYGFSTSLKKTMVVGVKNAKPREGDSAKIYTCSGTNTQRWRVRYVSDGFYHIFMCGTYLALGIKGNKATANADVQLAEVSDAKGQLWAIESLGKGYYRITSFLSSSIVLTVEGTKASEGTNIQVNKNKGAANQKFYLYKAERAAASNVSLDDGTYTIKCVGNTSYSLDIKDASKKSKANVQLNTANTTQTQKFYLQSDGEGFYYIRVIGSGKVLAAASASYIPAINVIQVTYGGKMCQKWSLQKTANGYQLINKASNRALIVSGDKYEKGRNVTSSWNQDLTNSKFKIARTTTLKKGIYSISSVKSASKVLQSSSSSNGAAIKLQSSNDSIAQRFEVERVNSGNTEIYRIRAGASGGWLTASGSSVIQSGNHNTSVKDANSWQLVWNGNYFSLRNCKTDTVLSLKDGATSNGTALQVKAASKSNTQHFYFTPANLIPNGTYLLSEAIFDNKAGDRVVDSKDFYVRSRTKTANRSQRFTLTAKGKSSSTYVIKNTYDGSTLSLKGTSKSDGLEVVRLENAGASTQQWVAKIADGGYVMFVNKYSGKAMTVRNGNEGTGVGIVQNTIYESIEGSSDKNRDSQKFKPIRIEWEVKGDKYYYYDENGNRSTWTKPTYTAYKKLNHNKEVQDEKNSKPYASTIDVSACWVNIFKKSGDLWAPYKCWRCSTGANNSNYATPRGVFHTTGKKGSYGETENLPWGFYYVTVWYPREYGGTGFHSIIYHPNSYNVLDGRLGVHITGGSVRLSLENAKWVYDHFSKGTIVYSY